MNGWNAITMIATDIRIKTKLLMIEAQEGVVGVLGVL